MTSQQTHQRQAGRDRRPRRQRSIRQGVVRVALVPSVALIALWLVGASYLGYTGVYARQVASSVRQVSIPAVNGLASLQKERQLSMAELANSAGTPAGTRSLNAQRATSDEGLASMQNAAKAALGSAPASIKDQMATVTGYLHELPKVRAQIDARTISPQNVYAFYNKILDASIQLFNTQARIIPDATASQGGFAATDLFRVSDLMSRAGSQAAGAFAAKKFSTNDYLTYVQLVGAYRSQLSNVEADLLPDVRAGVRRMMRSDEWSRLSAAEDAILADGAWQGGVPTGLPVDSAAWGKLTDQVSNDLIELAKSQADEVSAQGLASGNQNLGWAIGGSVAAAAVVALAILWALRRSSVLVGRTLIPRIRQLGEDANLIVRTRFPAIRERLAAGERVNVREELGQINSAADEEAEQGQDEIDNVRKTLNDAVVLAADAVVSEGQARAGVLRVFLGIAYRNQRPLQQASRALDAEERAEEDPARLEKWFRVHHRVNQVRGVNESLIILGGGKPGRKFQTPIPLLQVMQAAKAQAEDYDRVKLETAPEVRVRGDAVNGTIHLLTQLLNNAIGFSSTESDVRVRGVYVDRGIAIEVEDRGIGMAPEDLDQANAMLKQAPEFNVNALGDGSQLGFWVVAQLAKQLGITVTLTTSPYGGVLAVVLIPKAQLDNAADRSGDISRMAESVDVPRDVEQTMQMPAFVGAPPAPRRPGLSTNGAAHRLDSGSAHRPAPTARPVSPAPRIQPGTGHASLGARDIGVEPPARVTAIRQQPQVPERDARPGRPPLPERQPQQHIAPQLREDLEHPGTPEQAIDMGDPELIRNRLARFQQGSNAGRAEDN
ncbi:sensor histidine kinase [Actinocatenispora sera]|uniref:histidine kinase n=1 Tax=Actinocatenispora sera TaxID=390989 RepID=A0A810KTX0_9ACTN|nr:ATP-binding protein [Actinocatenispora sera]BCJ26683.1 histidine kinase [Actinocatenispora sera]